LMVVLCAAAVVVVVAAAAAAAVAAIWGRGRLIRVPAPIIVVTTAAIAATSIAAALLLPWKHSFVADANKPNSSKEQDETHQVVRALGVFLHEGQRENVVDEKPICAAVP
jgi:hypothetical protein